MAYKSTATTCILAWLCVFLIKETSAQCEPSVAPIAPIAPFGPLGTHVAPGPIEFVLVGPPPTADLLAPFGGNLIPNTPSELELSLADFVPVSSPAGCTLYHVSSFASPVQVLVNKPQSSAVEFVEPLIIIETAQCGCTVIRLYWLHEMITMCPLGTGRWAKTQVLGQAELVHEWVLHNVHDINTPPPCPFHPPLPPYHM